MSGRQEQKVDSFQPGPGTYAQLVKPIGSEAPSYTMAARPAGSSASDAVPGPGSYATLVPPLTGGVTMAGRHEDRQDDWRVGPGQYDVKPIHDGPEFSMAQRFPGSSSVYAATTNPMHFVRDRKRTGERPSAAAAALRQLHKPAEEHKEQLAAAQPARPQIRAKRGSGARLLPVV